jgi:hypothetical protein
VTELTPAPSPTPPLRSLPAAPLFSGACSILVIVGAMGPWAKVGSYTLVSGPDNAGGVGAFLGVVALVGSIAFLARQPRAWLAMVSVACLGAAAVLGMFKMSQVTDANAEFDELAAGLVVVSIGWGLVVMTLAGCLGAVASAVSLFQVRRAPGVAKAPKPVLEQPAVASRPPSADPFRRR